MIVWILHFKFCPVRNGALLSKDYLRLFNVSGHLQEKIILRSFEPWSARPFTDWANTAAVNVETVSLKVLGPEYPRRVPCAFSLEDACRWPFRTASTRSTVKTSGFFAVLVILSFWFAILKIYPPHVIMMSYCSFYRSSREGSNCYQSCLIGICYALSSFASTNGCCAIPTLCFSRDYFNSLKKCQMQVNFPGTEFLGTESKFRRRKKNLSWYVFLPWGNFRPRRFWKRRFFSRFQKSTHPHVAYSNRFRPSVRKH